MSKSLQQLLNKKIVVFGTGRSAREFSDELWFNEVSCYVDNNETLWDKKFNGKSIYNPEVLLLSRFREAKIIIASMYYDEIAYQLSEMGFIENLNFFKSESLLFHIRGGHKFPNGHFYSTIPDLNEIFLNKRQDKAIDSNDNQGIHFDPSSQLELLDIFKTQYYSEQPFSAKGTKEQNRYYFGNGYFESCDAITLYCMLRHIRPGQVIEIGSGFSSAAMLDVNEQFLNNKVKFTFIDPYPERLELLLKKADKHLINILSKPVQNVDLQMFSSLQAGDILFIDSSHVSKFGSDVNHIVFNILPILQDGVYIHFHDIFYPFEYPTEWLSQGHFWNESYLLRSFLQFNTQFSILFWGNYLYSRNNELIEIPRFQEIVNALPLCSKNIGGSLWLEKSAP